MFSFQPVRFSPAVEAQAPEEQEAIEGLKETFGTILDTTSKDYGHAVRGVHAKGHGLIRGTLTVSDGLPPELAQGLTERSCFIRSACNGGAAQMAD